MSAAKKTYWIGDDGDNKAVLIDRKIYVRGDEIPISKVDKATVEAWEGAGLISNSATVVITQASASKDSAALKELQVKYAALKSKGYGSGKKADRIKELEADVKSKDERIAELEAEKAHADEAWSIKVKDLELDNQEKAALIDKLNADLDVATAPPSDTGAGPGVKEDHS